MAVIYSVNSSLYYSVSDVRTFSMIIIIFYIENVRNGMIISISNFLNDDYPDITKEKHLTLRCFWI